MAKATDQDSQSPAKFAVGDLVQVVSPAGLIYHHRATVVSVRFVIKGDNQWAIDGHTGLNAPAKLGYWYEIDKDVVYSAHETYLRPIPDAGAGWVLLRHQIKNARKHELMTD